MAPGLTPYDDTEAALAGDASPWVRSLDGVWQFTLRDSPADVEPADRHAMSWPATGTRSLSPAVGCCRPTAATTAAHRSTSTCGCRSPCRRRTCRRATRPGSTGASSRSPRRGAAGGPCFVSGRRTRWASCGSTGHSSDSAPTVTWRRRTTSATICAAARTRSASSCRGGARRRGSRTRTSGGCRACTAASSWCRCRRCRSPTRRTVPGLEADGTTGTLDLDVGVDIADGSAPGPLTVEVVVTDPAGRRRRPLASTGCDRRAAVDAA